MTQMPTPIALARAALVEAPAGLLTDLDGTLAPIVDDPSAVRPIGGAVEALAALARVVAVVGIVSGRSAADVRSILGTDRFLVIGNHGLELLPAGSRTPVPDPASAVLIAAVESALRAVPAEPGLLIERKGLSATVHVRGCADPEAARRRVRAALDAAAPQGVEVRPGRMSLEVRPVGAGDKGTAVRAVVDRHQLSGIVVLGDDLTDLDMFRAAAELRAARRLHAAVLAIRGGREVPAAVEEAADAVLASPAAAVELIARLAEELATG